MHHNLNRKEKIMRKRCFNVLLISVLMSVSAVSNAASPHTVGDEVIADERTALGAETQGKSYGSQSPRDIGLLKGKNARIFSTAPSSSR